MPIRSLGNFYSRSFAARPWLTLAITNATLSVVADGLAQVFEQHVNASSSSTSTGLLATQSTQFSYDPLRGARFLAFGAGMAPVLAEWNKLIEHKFPLRKAAATLPTSIEMAKLGSGAGVKAVAASVGKVSLLALAKRVVVDQTVFAPVGLALFVGFMGFTEGRDVQGVQNKFAEVYWPALLANWHVWPLVQTLNFRFLPLKYRVPFVSMVNVGWTVYLSMLQSKGAAVEAQVQVDK